MLPRYTDLKLNDLHEADSPLIVPIADLYFWMTYHRKNPWVRVTESLMSIVLPTVYGMPHLLGWNATFPTHTEQVLWRTAALVVTALGWVLAACSGMIAILCCIVGVIDPSYNRWLVSMAMPRLMIPFMLFSTSVYVAASGYLLVDSFRQLFALPPGAFELASWTNAIPHFA